MTATTEPHRPVGVTILVVLLWIQAVLQVIGGAVLIFARNDVDILNQTSLSSGEMMAVGIGGIIIGVLESMAGFYLPQGWKDVVPYIVLLLVLLLKPEGLFGLKLRKKV